MLAARLRQLADRRRAAPTGYRSTPARVWDEIDHRRTAAAANGSGCRVDWADYALACARHARSAHADEQHVPRAHAAERSTSGSTAATTSAGPTLDDLEYHLTTLFPPVRPRGWLELRMIDAVPDPWWRVAVAVDRGARAATTALVDASQPRASRRRAAGGPTRRATGSHDPEFAASARSVLRRPRSTRCCRARHRRDDRARGRVVRRALRRAGALPRRRPARRVASAARRALPRADNRDRGDHVGVTVDRNVARRRARPARATARSRSSSRSTTPSCTAQVSPLMSPLVWDLAHIAHYEELWLLRDVAGARADRPALRRRLRRVQSTPRRAADARHPRPGRGAAVRGRRARRACSTSSRASTSIARRPAARATGSSTAWSSSTSTSTTRRCSPRIAADGRELRPSRCGRLAPRRARRSRAADGALVRRRWAVHARDATTPWAYDNERPEHDVDVAPFRIERCARHERRRTPRSSLPAATTTSGSGARPGGRWRDEAGLAAPAVLATARVTASWIATCGSGRVEDAPARRARAARVLVRGRRVRPLGRRGACPTEAEWEVAARVADAAGTPLDGRRVGVDGLRLPPAIPGFGRSPTASTPRCSSAPTTRCCAAARGPTAPARVPRRRSATGTTRSAARSSPASARADDALTPCAVTSRTSARRSRSARCCSEPRALARRSRRAAPRSRPAARRQPRRLGGRVVVDGAAEPERYRTATPMWADRALPELAPQVGHGRRARRGAQRHVPGRRSTSRAMRRSSPTGPGSSRYNGYRRRVPRPASATSCAPASAAGRLDGIDGDSRLRGALRARARPPRRGPHRSSTRSPTSSRRVDERGDGRLNLLLADGRRSRPPPWATRCSCSTDGAAARRVRTARRRPRLGSPSPTATRRRRPHRRRRSPLAGGPP